MSHLHLECHCGAAGDMLLAALIDLGVEWDWLRERLRRLPVEHFHCRLERAKRGGIDCAHFVVEEHHRGHDHHQAHGHHHGPHRHLQDMLAILEESDASTGVKERAAAVFRLLAEAEAEVHGSTPEKVHFHEVSGIDTLVDVCGVCFALERLGVETVSVWPVHVGGGTVACQHGVMPVPAPATAEILARANISFRPGPVERELLTPTGAALLAVLSERCEPVAMRTERIGYGAGAADFSGGVNAVRASIGQLVEDDLDGDTVVEMATVIDDMSPEYVAELVDSIRAAGAIDAWIAPVTMKKGRPGFELTVLASPSGFTHLRELVFRGSRTLGIRHHLRARIILPRETIAVAVGGQEIRVKVGRFEGEVTAVKAEFEDCRRAADVLNRSPLNLARAAEAMVWQRLGRT